MEGRNWNTQCLNAPAEHRELEEKPWQSLQRRQGRRAQQIMIRKC